MAGAAGDRGDGQEGRCAAKAGRWAHLNCLSASCLPTQADVFSFSVLLWEMATGRVPWRELGGHMQIVYRVGVLHEVRAAHMHAHVWQ